MSKGLDASFLPLRQSDMCLVCIAFASWVLKTANPQVGDAWKAGKHICVESISLNISGKIQPLYCYLCNIWLNIIWEHVQAAKFHFHLYFHAVLLANVSALSAIRYLRKYVKMEAAASEKILHDTTPSESWSLCVTIDMLSFSMNERYELLQDPSPRSNMTHVWCAVTCLHYTFVL